jgi:hypothetical protein
MKANPFQSADSFTQTIVRSVRRAWEGPRTSSESVDYRDRISVATWPIVVGLALSLFVFLPTVEFSFVAFGSPATIPVTGTLAIAFGLAILAASGAESVVSAHPHFATAAQRSRGRTWPFWALPMAMSIIMTMLLPRLPTALIQVLGLLLASVLLILVFFSLYVTVEPGQQGFRRARLVLNILTYAAAVVLFLFVYQSRARSLVSATLVAVTAMLLAIELLRTNTSSTIAIIGYGAIVGLLLGEVTWALNYWPLPNLTGGLLLLLVFYVLVSFAQAGLQKRLTARVAWELLIVTIVALVLLAIFGPGFRIAPPV